ncbi:MAG TPA: LacI family DNA-binding transcriptional regulator [Candidatus Dormibacteraeota bacterium]|nr:LacI family DNA-binding transcriptional regulator [Candidatus Dormibacteraeota bacterium]
MTSGARATIATIAREAGVSVPTVSRVLNGRADVAAATRSRIEALLSEHGYKRRRASAAMAAPVIDLVFHELDGAWAVEVIKGVTRAAREEGLLVVVSESAPRTTPGQDWVDEVLARRPMGVILVVFDLDPRQRTQLAARGIPFVLVDPAGEPAAGVPAIGSANWNGGLAAARHLLELGHRRIGVIGGPRGLLCSRARLDGYRAAMDLARVPIDPDLVRTGDFHVEGGHANGLALLRLSDPPTAVFAGSDLQALGVYEAARELGVRIPDQLSVVGYDDLSVSRWAGPPLTTIHQPLAEMAEMAARVVVTMSRGAEPVTRRLDLATSLVVRQSTAPPPAR